MNTFPASRRTLHRPAALAAVAFAALGLAGCGSPPPAGNQAYPAPVYQSPSAGQPVSRDYSRRANEPLYEVPVSSSRAVYGPGGQRCWIEREEVERRRNVPGAIVGGVIGGILGHQIGGGTGRDIATVGGAVAGAAVGSNVGRNNTPTQDVQRCTNVGEGAPDYWDVNYVFRGVQHTVQMTSPPGRTILVNDNGEPRL
jgi:hypothetical protein